MSKRKSDRLHVLVTPEQKASFQVAADAANLNLSAWVVTTLAQAARTEQERNACRT
jgi:uncharacterized protein (DUF1778 family)